MNKRPADTEGGSITSRAHSAHEQRENKKMRIRRLLPRLKAGAFDLDAESIEMLLARTSDTRDLKLYLEVEDVLEGELFTRQPTAALPEVNTRTPPNVNSQSPKTRNIPKTSADLQAVATTSGSAQLAAQPRPAQAARASVAPSLDSLFDDKEPASAASISRPATTATTSNLKQLAEKGASLKEEKPYIKILPKLLEGQEMLDWLGEPRGKNFAAHIANLVKDKANVPSAWATMHQLGLDKSNRYMHASITNAQRYLYDAYMNLDELDGL